MDPYTLGYKLGRLSVDVLFYVTSAQLSVNGYRSFSRIASLHKLPNNNPETITENIFKCLEFIDW